MNNILISLWDIVITLIEQAQRLWNFMQEPIKINIQWLRIPLIMPNGVNFNTGLIPIELLGGGIIALLIFWVVKSLVPFL